MCTNLLDPKMDFIFKQIFGSENEREKYRLREKGRLDELSAIAQATRDGIEQGKLVGEKNKALDIARNLIDVLPVEEISRITGLSTEDLREYLKELGYSLGK